VARSRPPGPSTSLLSTQTYGLAAIAPCIIEDLALVAPHSFPWGAGATASLTGELRHELEDAGGSCGPLPCSPAPRVHRVEAVFDRGSRENGRLHFAR
jgi:hypothetical protein